LPAHDRHCPYIPLRVLDVDEFVNRSQSVTAIWVPA
jgi:hypothetical protein